MYGDKVQIYSAKTQMRQTSSIWPQIQILEFLYHQKPPSFYEETSGAAGLTLTHPPIGVSEKLKRPPLVKTFCIFGQDFESRVFIENWKWVSKGCGSYFVHPGKPLAFPSL